jgi:hypothetical protein
VLYQGHLKGFGSWCEHLGDPNDATVIVSPQRPSQHPSILAASAGSAMRVSLEFPFADAPTGTVDGGGAFHQTPRFSTLQSFLILKL